MSKQLPYTHLLYVRQYSILTNDYQLYVYGVNTKDIYHTVGEFIFRSYLDIKSIKWVVCCQDILDCWVVQNIKIHNFYNKYEVKDND